MPSYSRSIQIPGKSSDEIFSTISSGIDQFLAKGPSNFGKFDIDRAPDTKTVSLKSQYATAHLVCREGEVVLEAKLGLIASAFRSKIDEAIDKWVTKTFQLPRA